MTSIQTHATVNRCPYCDGTDHPENECATATEGAAILMRRALDTYQGENKRFAEAIGIASTNLSNILSGKYRLGAVKRAIVVHYLRTGQLPAEPPARRAGNQTIPIVDPDSDGRGYRGVRVAKRDFYALVMLSKHEHGGEVAVMNDALAAWVEHHPTVPDFDLVVGDVATKIGIDDGILAAFDQAVGGADRRMEFMPTAIAEWVRRRDFAKVVGKIPADLDEGIERAKMAPRSVLLNERHRPAVLLVKALDACKQWTADGTEITTRRIGEYMGMDPKNNNQILVSLTRSGHLERVERGIYRLADPQPETAPVRAGATQRRQRVEAGKKIEVRRRRGGV